MGNPFVIVTIGPTATIAAGTGADFYWVSRLPGKWKIVDADFVPDIAMTANGTNYTTHTLTNVTKSLTIFTRSHAAADSAVGTPEAQTVTAGLAELVSDGDVLKFAKAETGTGLGARARAVLVLQQWDAP